MNANKLKEQLKSNRPKFYKTLKKSYYSIKRLNPLISSRYIYFGKGNFLDLKNKHLTKITPNLFIIGAEKCGTTSLHHYLNQHPDIFMSTPNKEPQYLMPIEHIQAYFDQAGIPVRDKYDLLKNHMLKGYRGEKYFGESTTTYTRGNIAQYHDIPKRITDICKDPKLIYIIRHPIERIISSYYHRHREGKTNLSLEEDIIESFEYYVRTSDYAYQLDTYCLKLDPSSIKIIKLEDLTTRPKKELEEIINFLSLPAHKFDTKQKYNVGLKSSKKTTLAKELKERLTKFLAPSLKQLTEKYGVDTSDYSL